MPLFNLCLLPNNLILFYWFRWVSKKCLGLNSYICVVFFFFFFVSEYHDFLICFHWHQCRRDCRKRVKTSSAIGRRWMKPVGKFTNSNWPWMNSLKAPFFRQEEGFQIRTALSLFTVKKVFGFANFLLLTCLWPTVTRHGKKPLRNPLATLLDIRASYCALTRRRTITMVYAIRGSALTQAIYE